MALGKKKMLHQAATGLVATENFATKLYTGNGGTQSITGLDFEPDLVWIKNRDTANKWHSLTDSVRGAGKRIFSNTDYAELTDTFDVQSFDSNGFTIGNGDFVSRNNESHVAWCFNAGTGAAASNTDGTITGTIKANQDAGFSICSWTATSSSSATIGHGLNSTPQLIIYKKRNTTSQWSVYSNVIDGSWDRLRLNTTEAKVDSSSTWGTDTTFKSISSVSGGTWITYCFTSITGYQKIGSYSGNGSSGGQTITGLGFDPRFLLVKNTTSSASWRIIDAARGDNNFLFPDTSGATDSNSGYISLITDGFRLNGLDSNTSDTFIYLAIK